MRMIQDRLDPKEPGAIGPPRRRTIALRDEARTKVLSLPWWQGRITNATIVGKLRSSSSPQPHLSIEFEQQSAWRPTIWFSPWLYQNNEQVWAGLAYEIIKQVTNRMDVAEREAFWLELNIRRVDGDLVRSRVYRALWNKLLPLLALLAGAALLGTSLLIAKNVLPGFIHLATLGEAVFAAGGLGTVVAAVFQTVAFWRQRATETVSSLMRQPKYFVGTEKSEMTNLTGLVRDPGYDGRLGPLRHLQADVQLVLNLVATDQHPLVIFLDDLDRCSPGTVSQTIEAINLFLASEFPNCVFVLGMEPEMVAAHIEVAYKDVVSTLSDDDYWDECRTLGWRFLDKIVQLPITLPVLGSGQASKFLGTSLSGHTEMVDSGQDQDFDQPRVHEIERSLHVGTASLDEIGAAAADAQEQLTGRPVTGALSQNAQAAARQELRRRLHVDSPEVQAIVAATSRWLNRNPRTIKRFVNVFRFYTVIRQEREGAGLPVPDSLDEVAKLAVVAVRWPHLRNALGRQIGPTERDTVLGLLEAPIAELPDDADSDARRAALAVAIDDDRLPPRLREHLLASPDLCDLLAHGPLIGTAAVGYL